MICEVCLRSKSSLSRSWLRARICRLSNSSFCKKPAYAVPVLLTKRDCQLPPKFFEGSGITSTTTSSPPKSALMAFGARRQLVLDGFGTSAAGNGNHTSTCSGLETSESFLDPIPRWIGMLRKSSLIRGQNLPPVFDYRPNPDGGGSIAPHSNISLSNHGHAHPMLRQKCAKRNGNRLPVKPRSAGRPRSPAETLRTGRARVGHQVSCAFPGIAGHRTRRVKKSGPTYRI